MFRYLTKYKILFFIYILVIFINELVGISSAFILRYIIDAATTLQINQLYETIKIVLLYLVIIFFVVYARCILRAKYLRFTMTSLKNDLFNRLIHEDIATFMQSNSARYISIFNNDLKAIENDYFDNFFNIVSNIFAYVIAFAFMFYLNPIIALASVIISILPLLVPSIFAKRLSSLRHKYMESLEIYNVKIKDFFAGFEVIKSFNILGKIKENHARVNQDVEDSNYKFNSANAAVDAVSNFLTVFMQFAVFLIAGFLVVERGLTVGTMVAALQLCGMTVHPIRNIVQNLASMKSVKSINEKVLNLIDSAGMKQEGILIEQFKDCIEFKDVAFSYNSKKNVLHDINFRIEKGKKYAIVGASGSGKSTLAKLIMGYYKDYSGNILLDGVEIREINAQSIGKTFSIIHQNVFMFDDTLENNITLFNNYDDYRIMDSIKVAGLNEFVDTLDEGLQTRINESGMNLSGGERQRVAIARAVVTGSEAIILDEATANLDNQIAFDIEKSILDADNMTSIVITHRLNRELLILYDEILVLKNGSLLEQGKFSDLMDKKGYFYSLFSVAN